jgi:hypothetical protein
MRRVWWIAAIVAALIAPLIVMAVGILRDRPAYEQWHTSWNAGSISNSSAHDIWIEYNTLNYRIVGIYRDHDGDGLVDEWLLFCGPFVDVFCDTNHDGLMDTVRHIKDPLGSATRVEAAERGPFTGKELDERATRFPAHWGVEGAFHTDTEGGGQRVRSLTRRSETSHCSARQRHLDPGVRLRCPFHGPHDVEEAAVVATVGIGGDL